MKVLLEKLSDNDNAFRGMFEGDLLYPPKIGQSFTVTGKPLNNKPDYGRYFTSSAVKEISIKDKAWTIKTENSVYKLVFKETE